MEKLTFEDFLTEAKAPKKKITVKLKSDTEWEKTLTVDVDLNGQTWKFRLASFPKDTYRATASNIHPVGSIIMIQNNDWSNENRVFGYNNKIGEIEELFFKQDIVISKEEKAFDNIVCSFKDAVKRLADYRKENNTTATLFATYMRNSPGTPAAFTKALKILIKFLKEYFASKEGIEFFNSRQESDADKVLVS